MPQWNDLLLRKDLSDSGNYPFQGGWTMSPDIIPNGTAVSADPNAEFGGAANYGKDQGKQTKEYEQNYFYMRTKNLAASAEEGDLYLYYCPQSLFLFPAVWSDHQLSTIGNKESVHVKTAKTDDIAVTTEPFKYTPTSAEHACLIGRVTTTKNPNPLPKNSEITTWDQLGKYLCNHPNMAWRNIDLVPSATPTFTRYFTIDSTSISEKETAQFLIAVSYKNLVVGSELAFSAESAIPSGPDRGKVLQLVKTPVLQSSGSIGDCFAILPGGWKTTVTYRFWAKDPGTDWEITFFAARIKAPGANVAYAELFKPLHLLGIPGIDKGHHLLSLFNGEPELYMMGTVTVKAGDR